METAARVSERRERKALLLLLATVVMLLLTLVPAGRTYAAGLKLNTKKIVLYLGGPKTYQVKTYYKGKKVNARYRTSASRIAAVNSKGVVTAKRAGRCYVTAKYGKKSIRVAVYVRRDTARYRRILAKYRRFLKLTYITYSDDGSRGRADNFCSYDLDGDGVPELLAAVVKGSDRYYVLYSFEGGKITFGQRLGACTAFSWYPNAKVLAFRTFSDRRSIYHYARYNDGELEDVATVVVYKGKTTYYAEGEKVSALSFRKFVDHDLLNYEAPQVFYPYVNTAANRSAYLK